MTELVKGLTELSNHSALSYAANLLRHYSFELDEFTIEQLLSYWLDTYPVNWVRLAAIEALYQGRYKAVSVEQILVLWKRRGQPVHHFNHEFERLVCDKFPRDLLSPADPIQTRKKTVSQGKTPVIAKVGPFQYQTLFQQLQPHPDATHLGLEKSQQNSTLAESESPNRLSEASAKLNPALASLKDRSQEDRENQESEEPQPGGAEPIASAEVDKISPPSETDRDQQSGADRASGNGKLTQPETEPNSSSVERSDLSDRGQSPSKLTAEPISSAETSLEPPVEDSSAARQLSVLFFTVEHILPGLSLTAPSLKPKLKLQLTTLYQPKWLIGDGSNHPIHQFTPTPEASDFHTKLRSVAESSEGD